MVRIRLKRVGTKKRPYYRVVIIPSQRPRQGRVIEEIGVYQPLHDPSVRIKIDRFQYWVKQGAVPSDTVYSLIKHNHSDLSKSEDKSIAQ